MFQPYQTIVTSVDAFRVSDDLAEAAEVVGGSILTGTGGRSVGLPGGAGQAHVGDWICRSDDGRLWVELDSAFQLMYVADEEEKKPTRTRSKA